MKKISLFLFIAITMLNCKNNEKKVDKSIVETDKKEIDTLDLGCYIFNDGKNTVTLEIIEMGTNIKGNLTYLLAEKDKNSGTFTGQLKGNILTGTYTFESEGSQSSREVAFKVDNNTLIEGYGALDNSGTTFKNPNNLNFTSKMPLTKMDCQK
ncbi:hypothetical protein [Flavobacterium sp.]|uniref:hypothetical protein n=1 Tax=Flavobacterium sp. TaxID=239 RepID=UPI003C4674ED